MPSWQNNVYPPFNPYGQDPSQILASMQNNALTSNIYDSTNKIVSSINDSQRLFSQEHSGINKNVYDATANTLSAINDSQRLFSQEFAGVNKNIYDTIAANGIAIERTAANGMATTERVNNQLSTAVERTAGNGMATTERATGQVANAVERNGGQIMAAVEKVAGEGRLTTTVTDAASRQAANDSARDILRAVDRVGSDAIGNIKDTHNGLLGAIERNAGEGRVQTLQSNGQLAITLTDVRHSILNDVNRASNEILSSNQQNLNVITKHVTDSAWESRSALAAGFQNISEEHLKTKHDLAQQASTYYASNLLENQKSTALLAKQQDNQFAAMISKSDNHFAALLLEQQKVKECLTLQLQEAKYEALKNKNELSKEMGDCCCEIKMKVDQRSQDVINTVDTLDRNRLRDDLTVANNENNVLKILEFYQDGDYGYGRGRGRRHGSRGRRGH
jgi:hypothetical protein